MRGWLGTVLLLTVAISAHANGPQMPSYAVLKSVVANMGPKCRIKVSLPAIGAKYGFNYAEMSEMGSAIGGGNGGLTVWDSPFFKGEWHLQFTCYRGSSEQAMNDTVAYDNKKQRWTRNPQNPNIIPEQHLKVYTVKTPNAQGWAYTDDDTATEFPERRMQYCVYHGERAICGNTDVGSIDTIRRHPFADRTPYVLKILNSIEFLEDAPQPSGRAEIHP